MTKRQKARVQHRRRIAMGVRRRLSCHGGRLRLSVFRSSKNIYCQVIDDEKGRTVASASSVDKDLRSDLQGLKKGEVAERVGQKIAARALDAGVKEVAFDRGPYKYHGRIKALADAARKGGLQF